MEAKLGYPGDRWDEAKEQMRTVLIESARRRGMITYSELVEHITAIRFHYHESGVGEMLGEYR